LLFLVKTGNKGPYWISTSFLILHNYTIIMSKKKATVAQKKKERNPSKVKKVLKDKGYPKGKLSKGKVLHHIKPVSEKGKTTKKNTKVITEKKHKQIHKNRRKRGKV